MIGLLKPRLMSELPIVIDAFPLELNVTEPARLEPYQTVAFEPGSPESERV